MRNKIRTRNFLKTFRRFLTENAYKDKPVKVPNKSNNFSESSVEIKKTLLKILYTWPDVNGLHSRTELAVKRLDDLNNNLIDSSNIKIKIGIVPFKISNENSFLIDRFTNILISDPLASDYSKWISIVNEDMRGEFKDGENRYRNAELNGEQITDKAVEITETNLKENTENSHNAKFEFGYEFNKKIVNNNSNNKQITIYSIPSSTLKLSFSSIVKIHDWDNYNDLIKDCDLHIFLSDSVKSLTSHIPSQYPNILVVDNDEINTVFNSNIDKNSFTNKSTFFISTKLAQDGLEKLQESRQNTSIYLKKWEESNIPNVINTITNKPFEIILTRNIKSIIYTIENESESIDKHEKELSSKLNTLIKSWGRNSNIELQLVLEPKLNTIRTRVFPWWKLFFNIFSFNNKIKFTFTEFLNKYFLPTSSRSLDYLLGEINGMKYVVNTNGKNNAKNDTKINTNENTLVKARAEMKEQITILQNVAKKIIKNTIITQIPIFSTCFLSWLYLGQSAYSMGSIVSFGILWSIWRLINTWDKALQNFSINTKEQARVSIIKGEKNIYELSQADLKEKMEIEKQRQEVLCELKTILRAL